MSLQRAVVLLTAVLCSVPALHASPKADITDCPAAADIAPCRCSVDLASRLVLECYNVESADQLAAVFQANFTTKSFYNLYVDDSPNLRTLGDIFNGVSFEVIEFYNTGIEVVNEYAFIDSVSTLQRLHIVSSLIHEATFPFLTIGSYSALTVLDLFTNEIQAIPALYSDTIRTLNVRGSQVTSVSAGTFQGLTSVTSINLEGNSISSLEEGAFSDLPSLQSLSLTENSLTQLGAGAFPLVDQHMTIYLWGNQIASIEPDAFILPSTNESFSLFLDLGANQLTTLDEAVFAPLFPHFDFLFIASNPFTCGCDMAWFVRRPDWVAKIGNTAQCADGTWLVDLLPEDYVDC